MPSPAPAPPGRAHLPAVKPGVFYPSLGIIGVFVLLALAVPEATGTAITAVQSTIIGGLGWYYVLLITSFVVFSLWVGLGRFGSIRLGADGERPAFGLGAWFAMLFSAGMGIGLVFWGVAEPLNHFASPRPGFAGDEVDAARQAVTTTYLHWGLHAWAIYVVAGLAIAYAVHRRGRPVSIRWALEPLLGERVRGRLGDVIDVTAVVGTLFGVATSLGFGVAQLAAGLDFSGVLTSSTAVQVVLALAITALATISVVSGVGRGIKWLSTINMGVAGTLLVFVLVAGPTLFIARELVQSLGDYLSNVLRLSFDVSAYRGEEGQAWQATWTTFYWGWWVSWAPFVGVFIARISRGRTVREFVAGVLLVPTALTFLWFSVLGGTAIYRELFGQGGLVADDGTVDTEASLFGMLEGLPGGPVVIGLAMLLIVTFFVTSADSGSLVVAMLSSGGDPDPARWVRILWSTLGGVVAAALLVVGGGGLSALQTAAIITALPFSVVMIGMALSLGKALRAEHHVTQRRREREQMAAITEEVGATLGALPADGDARPRGGAGRAGPVRDDVRPSGALR